MTRFPALNRSPKLVVIDFSAQMDDDLDPAWFKAKCSHRAYLIHLSKQPIDIDICIFDARCQNERREGARERRRKKGARMMVALVTVGSYPG